MPPEIAEKTEQMSDEPPSMKRARTAKSCLICRQKKTKCDKAKPVCGTCLKRDNPQACHYREPQWNIEVFNASKVPNATNPPTGLTTSSGSYINGSPFSTDASPSTPSLSNGGSGGTKNSNDNHFKNRTSKDQELIVMNERIKQLENIIQKKDKLQKYPGNHFTPYNSSPVTQRTRHNDDCIDFYKYNFTSSVNTSQGALSWVSLLRKDAYLNAIILSRKQKNMLTTNQDNVEENQGFLEKYQLQDIDASFVEGNVPCPMSEPKGGFLKMVKDVLKDVKLVWILVDKFFESEFFLVLAVIDKIEFTTRLVELIGTRAENKINLRLSKKVDLAILGTLLLVMRVTSLITYNFGKKPFRVETPSDQYIIDHPVPEKEILLLINRCHRQVRHFNEPSLDVFQFLSFKVYYEFFSPEEADCVKFADSGSIGKLLNYAIQCGLNRDPSSNPNIIISHKNPNLLRRLWYKIVYLDSHQLMLIGCPPVIDYKFYDTKFPVLEESTDEFDMEINKWFYDRAQLYDICYPLLMLILNVREKPKISRAQELLKPLVDYTESLPTLGDIMEMPLDTLIQRVQKLKYFIYWSDCYSLIYMVYYNFFLFYNEKNNREESVFFFKKILQISSTLYESVLFLDKHSKEYDLQKHFGCATVAFPKIEVSIHRIALLMFSVLSRVKSMKAFKATISDETLNFIDEIAESARRCVTFITTKLVSISDTYYHPWMVSKVHAYIMCNLLQFPKGRGKSSINTETDVEFFKVLNKSRGFDKIFEVYTDDDFREILQEFGRLDKVEEKANASRRGELSPPWNLQMVNENDKKWFDQLATEVQGEASTIPHHGDNLPYQYMGLPNVSPDHLAPPPFVPQRLNTNTNNNPSGPLPPQSQQTALPLRGQSLAQKTDPEDNHNPGIVNDMNYLNDLINNGVDILDFNDMFGLANPGGNSHTSIF